MPAHRQCRPARRQAKGYCLPQRDVQTLGDRVIAVQISATSKRFRFPILIFFVMANPSGVDASSITLAMSLSAWIQYLSVNNAP
jgi:hypothetical protein